jgi:predicted Zn-dependent peptidase
MVYLSVYKNAPRIQTYIVTRAGSKNDPATATGLAHYLEHMLFKGTDKFGTKDYEHEKVYVDRIIELYDVHAKTTDPAERKRIYRQIDSLSLIASNYAIPNEYDKMTAYIGATGTNASTWDEKTVYQNDIPSNQLENFLKIEAERFRNPVMRLFHTELEAVYEEKNRGLDNDYVQAYEKLYAGVYKKHPYGQQTGIGTIEHLKNPSIKTVMEYYNTYYVPNNMAICLSGDFDPDTAIRMIDKYFGSAPSKEVPVYSPPAEDPISSPEIIEHYGPNAEFLLLAFRLPGANTREADLLTLMDMLLSNSKAGLVDLNLNQAQKVLSAGTNPDINTDYSTFLMSGEPREGQTLDEVRDLLLSQIELIKNGDFPDWLPSAVLTDLKLRQLSGFESNENRADAFVQSFTMKIPWDEYILELDRLSKYTKEDIVNFARQNFKNNYVAVYKKTGENKVQKVEKPEITPVNLNREDISPFVQDIMSASPPAIEPVFLDYKKDITEFSIKNNIPVLYLRNTENDLFSLYYVFDMGTNNNRKLSMAISYLEYLGTSKYTPAQIQQEFYKLGCTFSVFSSTDQVYVSLSGLNENFAPALSLFEELLADAQPNKEALDNLVQDVFKKRADNKLSKNVIQNALISYGKYGPKSPFTNILSKDELMQLTPGELINIVKDLRDYQHKVLYYGPMQQDMLTADLDRMHNVPASLKPVPQPVKFTEQPTDRGKVYVVNYDMVQAEVVLLSKKDPYDRSIVPVLELYNDYFGTGMSSVMFQEMRESKALAYSVYSVLSNPSRVEDSKYIFSYIGTQADKLPEAMEGMMGLLNNMPQSENAFTAAKNGIIKKIQSDRVIKSNILFNYLAAQKLGLEYDIRSDIYRDIPNMTFNDIKTFHDKYVKDSKYTILVLGDKNKLDINTLSKYGTVEYLTLEDIFGY